MASFGGRKPDATQVPVNNGAATAAAQYKSARSLVFLTAPGAEMANWIKDKGWSLIDFSEPHRWSEQFAAHPGVFGPTSATS